MIVDAFPEGRPRRRAIAVWTGVAAVGGASGLVLGGLIADALGWRWVFLINIPIGIVALALTPWLLTESRTAPRRLDLLAAAAATGGLACSSPRSPASRWRSRVRRRWSRSSCGGRAAAEPLVVRDRTVAIAAAAGALLTATTSGTGVLASLYLQGDAGLGPSSASLALLPLSVRWSPVDARRADGRRHRARRRGCAALALGGVSSVVVWGVLAGYGLGAASVAATTLGTGAVAEADRGGVSGLLSTAAQGGAAVGVATLVLVGGTAAFLAAAVAAVAGAVMLRPRRAAVSA